MVEKKKDAQPERKPPAAGKLLSDFRAEHDKSFIVPKRINEALVKLGEGWLYEMEFMKLAHLSTTDLAAYREEFTEHIVNVGSRGGRSPKRIWVGNKELAKTMREMV